LVNAIKEIPVTLKSSIHKTATLTPQYQATHVRELGFCTHWKDKMLGRFLRSRITFLLAWIYIGIELFLEIKK
jgi:hypothetical protein